MDLVALLKDFWHVLFHGGFLGTDLHTWMGLALLLVLSAAIWVIWFLWFLGRHGQALYAIIAAQVASTAQILGWILILGWVGLLRAVPLAVTCMATSAVPLGLGILPERSRIRLNLSGAWRSCRAIRLPRWGLVLLLLYGALLARGVLYAWFIPPYDLDGIAYHLPIMASFVQLGAIRPLDSLSVWIRYYPFDSELTQLWNFIFVGIGKVVELAFLPTVLAGVLATYGLGRRFGLSRNAALLSAAVVGFTPSVFLEQTSSYNDAWMAAIFIAATYLILAHPSLDCPGGRMEIAVLAGAAAGIAVGTKYTGLLLAGILLVLLLVRLWKDPSAGGVGRGERWAVGGLFLAALILFGSYPYVRDYLVGGNPIAPNQITFAGHVLLPGSKDLSHLESGDPDFLVNKSWGEHIYLIWLERLFTPYDWNNAGGGPLWVVLGLPGLVVWAIASVRKRRGWPLLLTGLLVLFFVVTPANFRIRYVLAAILPCALGAGCLVDYLQGFARGIVLALAVLLSAWVVFSTLRPAQISPVQLRNLVAYDTDYTRTAGRLADPTAVYEWIDAQTQGHPTVIAYGRRVHIYPLFGVDLRNPIVHQVKPSQAEWEVGLDQQKVSLVVTDAGSKEDTWMRGDPLFREAFAHGYLVVYQRR